MGDLSYYQLPRQSHFICTSKQLPHSPEKLSESASRSEFQLQSGGQESNVSARHLPHSTWHALKVGGPSNFMVKAIYINNSFKATKYMLFQWQWQVAEILEQHRIKVKNFCLFPHDNVVTAHCAHCRLTLSRQQPTTCIVTVTDHLPDLGLCVCVGGSMTQLYSRY